MSQRCRPVRGPVRACDAEDLIAIRLYLLRLRHQGPDWANRLVYSAAEYTHLLRFMTGMLFIGYQPILG